MSEVIKPRSVDFRRGQETTREEQSDDIFSWRELMNARMDGASLRRRKGMQSLYAATTVAVSMDLDGTNDYVTIPYDSRIWDLNALPIWTLETLVNCDSLAAQRQIFGRNEATTANRDLDIYQDSTSGGRVVAVFYDTAATATTLTVTGIAAATKCAIRCTRANSAVSLTVNGTTSTGTLTDGGVGTGTSVHYFGRNQGGNYYDGKAEFVRLFNGLRPSFDDAFCRLLDPRANNVMADYCLEADANNYCLDRSPWNNHGTVSGSPATSTSLAVNHAPVRGIAFNKNQQGQLKAYFWAGKTMYGATL